MQAGLPHRNPQKAEQPVAWLRAWLSLRRVRPMRGVIARLRRRLGSQLSARTFDLLLIAAVFLATRVVVFAVMQLASLRWGHPDPGWASLPRDHLHGGDA